MNIYKQRKRRPTRTPSLLSTENDNDDDDDTVHLLLTIMIQIMEWAKQAYKDPFFVTIIGWYYCYSNYE